MVSYVASLIAPPGPILLLSMLKTLKSYLFFKHSDRPSDPLADMLLESKNSM